MGTSQSAVARYESGETEPRADTLRRLLDALDHDLTSHARTPVDEHDVALARWSLDLSPDERVDHWESWVALADEARVVA